jgi:hypothetical protein
VKKAFTRAMYLTLNLVIPMLTDEPGRWRSVPIAAVTNAAIGANFAIPVYVCFVNRFPFVDIVRELVARRASASARAMPRASARSCAH